MAFLQCNFHSDLLGKACGMNVLVPQRVKTQIGMSSCGGRALYPVLYLLHGLSDDYTIWMRRTSIERYVSRYNLVVVMPDGGRSFYTDMAAGGRYWSFLSEELPQIVGNLFPVSPEREHTFAAGLSMGGYGALKLGLRRPDRFAAVGAFSALTDVDRFLERRRETPEAAIEANAIFGAGRTAPPEDDLFVLLQSCAALPPEERPAIFQCCGTEDMLYDQNRRFRDRVRELGGFRHEFLEGPGGHTWEFWDESIRKFLATLPLSD